MTLELTSAAGAPRSLLAMTAAFEGRVSGKDGKPLSGVTVSVYTFNARESWRGETNADGEFYIPVPSSDDIAAAMGERLTRSLVS